MRSSRFRPTLIVAAISLILAGLLASSASAEVTGSQITAPGDPTYLPFFSKPLESTSTQTLAIAGTTVTNDGNASDSVEIGCFYTAANGAQAEYVLQNLEEENVKLTVHGDGSFTTADLSGANAAALSSFWHEQPCTLRAIPSGTAATANVEAFAGPRVGNSGMNLYGNDPSHLYDDYVSAATLRGSWGWDSAGSCGPYGRVFAADTFQAAAAYTADCQADLYKQTETSSGASIVVDGHNGYDVKGARDAHNGAPGQPFLALGASVLDPSTGYLTQTETEQIVRCEAADGSAVDVPNPNSAQCVQFVPTGVKLVRTIATGRSGLQATVTDQFESETASSHSIGLSYGEEQGGNGSGQKPSYRFPGESGYYTHGSGDSAPTGTSAPMTLYYQSNSEAANPENPLENPRGAITVSAVPDATKFGGTGYFEWVYSNRTVPASGSLTFVHILSQALTQSEVEALVSHAQGQLAGPQLSIASPASGATVSTPKVQVSGTASDSLGVASVTVDGTGTPVAGDGSWSASQALNAGANTITVVATDSAGKTATQSITVTYVPPTPVPPVVTPVGHAKQIGAVSGAGGKVSVTIGCTGAAGAVCHVTVALTTVERLRGRRLVAVIARARTHSKRLTVATLRLSIPAGQRVRVSLKLNAAGRRLLARFGKLPVHIAVVSTSANVKTTVIAQNLTVRPVRKHKKRHH